MSLAPLLSDDKLNFHVPCIINPSLPLPVPSLPLSPAHAWMAKESSLRLELIDILKKKKILTLKAQIFKWINFASENLMWKDSQSGRRQHPWVWKSSSARGVLLCSTASVVRNPPPPPIHKPLSAWNWGVSAAASPTWAPLICSLQLGNFTFPSVCLCLSHGSCQMFSAAWAHL